MSANQLLNLPDRWDHYKIPLLFACSIILIFSSSVIAQPDIILHNANVITMDEEMPEAEAIAITGNRISTVSTDAGVLALKTASTQLIDLEGKTVVPGLIEGHDHLLQRGYFENGSEGLARATQRMAANGYTTVHQLFSSEGLITTAQELAQRGELAVRVHFLEPGTIASEEATVMYEDDLAGWEENDGLGFAYMYDNDQTAPYIGVAMFDKSGNHANDALAFNEGFRLDWGGDELRFSKVMRNGIIMSEAADPGNYSILIFSGPFSIDAGQSISPFMVAFVVGENLDDLKNAVNQAYQRSILVTSVEQGAGQVTDKFRLYQNYPNPFNSSTTIWYFLPVAEQVKVEVFDLHGQRVITLLDEPMFAGDHRIGFNAQNLEHGVYVLRVEAGTFRAVRKMFYLKK